MVEYVWVLHEFKPQEADEISLKPGDRVEVVEKDDVYQDGWWKGTNPAGKTGLFPKSYTTDKPPTTPSQSAADRPGVTFPVSSTVVASVTAEAPTPTNGSHAKGLKEERERSLSNGEITMQATMTDVQRAIEQLGRDDNDGNRSFSFGSLHDDYSERSETNTDAEASDVDDGTDWHRNAREKLALRAQMENEQRMKESGSVPSTPMRITAPPIDVELSDESDDDEDPRAQDVLKSQRRHSEGTPDSKFATRYSYIPEEDEAEVAEASRLPSGRPSLEDRDATVMPSLPSAASTIPKFSHSLPSPESDNGLIVPSEDYIVPSPGVNQDDLPTATADRLTFDAPLVASPDPSPALSAQTQSTEPSPIPPPALPPVAVVIPPPSTSAPIPAPVHIAAPAPVPAAMAASAPFRTFTPVATPSTRVSTPGHRRVASSSSAVYSTRSASIKAPSPAPVVEAAVPAALISTTPSIVENESTPVIPAASVPSISSVAAPSVASSAPSTVKLAPIPIKTNDALPLAMRSGVPSPGLPLPSPSATSSAGSIGFSSAGKHQSLTPATTPMSLKTQGQSMSSQETSPPGTREGGKKTPTTHPSEWSLEEVADWLMSKGFDLGVCEKFLEQEITGDVLLELNNNILKDEIGITKWGQRQRIMNAITELRRPRSFVEYDRHPMPSLANSRSQSLNYGHSHTSSIQSSAQQSYNNSPLGYAGPGFSPPQSAQTMPIASMNMGPGSYGSFSSADAPVHQMPFPDPPMSATSAPVPGYGWQTMESGVVPQQSEITLNNGRGFQPVPEGAPLQTSPAPLVGLGLSPQPASPASSRPQSPGASTTASKPSVSFAADCASVEGRTLSLRNAQKGRPSNLIVSASDQHLNVRAVGEEEQAIASGEEDRGAMSEPDGPDTKSKRRRLFGRSAESASIKEKASSLKEIKESSSSRHSKESSRNDGSSKISAGDEVPPMRRHSKKKSGDDRSKSDRLSLFGGSIGGAIAKKARKPVPRLSSGGLSEKSEKDKEKDKEKEKEKSEKMEHSEKPEKAERAEHDWTSLATFTRMRHHSERKASGRPSTSDGSFRKEKGGQTSSPKDRPMKDPALLRKRTSSMTDSVSTPQSSGVVKPGKSILQQIGTPDHNGWMRKKSDHYNSWKLRYFVLKGSHLYCLKSNDKSETKIKGYINIVGYKVIADENIDPGRYGFRIVHDSDKTHYFSHDEQIVIREWMKALMKATITRDFTNPVASSSNIPTIPLAVAQAMNPSPRPPSPSARAATQRAHRRENPNQLSSRDAQVLLMAMPQKSPSLSSPSLNGSSQDERARVESFFTNNTVPSKTPEPASPKRPLTPKAVAPPRPSREQRRKVTSPPPEDNATLDDNLIDWANSHLPEALQITDPNGPLCGGLGLLRIAEHIKGTQSSPPVADSAFPSGPNDDKLDGLFALFDFLLENDVKMGAVSINDIRLGKKQKVVQILQALRTWEQKRNSITTSIAQGSLAGAGYMAGPVSYFN